MIVHFRTFIPNILIRQYACTFPHGHDTSMPSARVLVMEGKASPGTEAPDGRETSILSGTFDVRGGDSPTKGDER